MKEWIFLLIIPIINFGQVTQNNSQLKPRNLNFSLEGGAKIFSGNSFLDIKNFTREGVFISSSIFTEIYITDKLTFKPSIEISLSNAFAKKIELTSNAYQEEENIIFSTKIPNNLSSSIFCSIAIEQTINKIITQSIKGSLRLVSLFYKKGRLFNGEFNSISLLSTPENNGALPNLDKSIGIYYSISYLFNNQIHIVPSIFLNSDFNVFNFPQINPLYFGGMITLQKNI